MIFFNMQFQAAVVLSLLLIGTCRIRGDGRDEKYEYSPYHYEYKVHDDKEYLDFGQEEEDDGKASHPAHHSSGHHGGRFGKSLDLSTQPGNPHKTSSHFGRQGKSLNFGEDLRNSESQP